MSRNKTDRPVKARNTPAALYQRCHNPKTGLSKIAFRTEAAARKYTRKTNGHHRRAYQCRHCSLWHLTSQPMRTPPE